MKLSGKRVVAVTAATLWTAASAGTGFAGLSAVGPIDQGHGFPSWYKDNTPASQAFPNGVALELCLDPAAGCILPILGPNPAGGLLSEEPENYDPNIPLNFKVTGVSPENPIGHVKVSEGGNFPGESFFYYATASARPFGQDGSVVYIAAIEAAFAGSGDPAQGMQSPFVRIRIDLNKVPPGTYTIVHPYGEPQVLTVEPKKPGEAFGDARYVSDIPLKTGQPFTDSASTMTNFLLPAVAQDGAPLPPVVPDPLKPAEQFLSDTPGPVTNGPFGRNFVRVTGPSSATITNFSVTGKLSASTSPFGIEVAAAPPSPAVPGTTVELSATSTNPAITDMQYRFSLLGGSGWQVVKDWAAPVAGTAAGWSWNTTGVAPGTYSIRAEGRSAATPDEIASKTIIYQLNQLTGPAIPASSVRMIAVPASPRTPGTSIFFAAAAVGRALNYEYRYAVQKPKQKVLTEADWTPWSPNQTWTWNTGGLPAGKYTVKVQARTIGTTAAKTQSLPYTLAP